jgi:predicted DNA repair protein MutK
MTISLAAITVDSVWMRAAVLAVVGISITVAVYGAVAAIVKADDLGLLMAKSGRLGLTRALGRGIVHWMPTLLFVLTWVGTAAMLWVGGQVVVHGLGQRIWCMAGAWLWARTCLRDGSTLSKGWSRRPAMPSWASPLAC